MNRILILFAHPSLERSEVNSELLRASSHREGVTVVDLYGEYPDYRIDIDREQRRLREHDAIVFMFPLFWYSTPALLKEWQDLVLEYEFAYGNDETELQGKTLLCALTAGGPEKAYRADGFNHFTLRELLRPIEQTASFCGMRFIAPFVLFGSRTAVEEGRVREHVRDWGRVLEALVHDRIDLDAASGLPTLNGALDRLLSPCAAEPASHEASELARKEREGEHA